VFRAGSEQFGSFQIQLAPHLIPAHGIGWLCCLAQATALRATGGLIALFHPGQHVIAHQGGAQFVGGQLRRFSAVGLHQQIGVREAIPVAPGPRSEQPDPAGQIAQRLCKPLLQIRQSAPMALATQPFEGTEFAHSHGATLVAFLLAESSPTADAAQGLCAAAGSGTGH
jgi:hypothetical protein